MTDDRRLALRESMLSEGKYRFFFLPLSGLLLAAEPLDARQAEPPETIDAETQRAQALDAQQRACAARDILAQANKVSPAAQPAPGQRGTGATRGNRAAPA